MDYIIVEPETRWFDRIQWIGEFSGRWRVFWLCYLTPKYWQNVTRQFGRWPYEVGSSFWHRIPQGKSLIYVVLRPVTHWVWSSGTGERDNRYIKLIENAGYLSNKKKCTKILPPPFAACHDTRRGENFSPVLISETHCIHTFTSPYNNRLSLVIRCLAWK